MGSGSGSGDYSQYITPADKAALMSEEIFNDIFEAVTQGSLFMKLARRLPNMAKGQERLRITDTLPAVFHVGTKGSSDKTFGSIKKTTKMSWIDKYIEPVEIACLVPIPENLVDDQDYPIWDEVKPAVVQAIGQLVDLDTFYGVPGVTVPAAWPQGIVPGCPLDHIIALGQIGDLYDDLLGLGGVWNEVEEDGYLVTGVASDINMKARLRSLRDGTTGMPIFIPDPTAKMGYTLDGSPFSFALNGAWDPSVALLVAGDFQQAVWSIRKDVTYKVLTEAVITDENYQIIHNLAQEDMVALRITFRYGWQLPNPVNPMEPDKTQRYPFAILGPSGSGSGGPVIP